MPLRVELPQVGETVTEGTLQRWLKRPGERVEKYEPLAEVVTDKVTLEVPSPVSGVLVNLLVPEGATVPMGAPICEIETEEAPEAVAPAEAPRLAEGPVPFALVEEPGVAMGPTGVREVVKAPPAEKERPRLSPVVQRLAQEHGIPLEEVARIPGTGTGGRVTKQDLLRYMEQRRAAPPARPEAPPPVEAGPEEEAIPVTPIRRRIAENMTRVATQVPMALVAMDVDVTDLVRWRESIKEEFQRREGVELNYLAFVCKAVVESLKEHPKLNSSWAEDRIILKRRINLGIAIAAPQGLVVPVVHDADRLSIAGLARAVHDLVVRARENRLTLQDVQGGTFTINNAGVLGATYGFSILVPGQSAILNTGAIVKQPVAVDDAIALRHRMVITLTFDHRALDGHDAAPFLLAVKRRLEAMGPQTPLY